MVEFDVVGRSTRELTGAKVEGSGRRSERHHALSALQMWVRSTCSSMARRGSHTLRGGLWIQPDSARPALPPAPAMPIPAQRNINTGPTPYGQPPTNAPVAAASPIVTRGENPWAVAPLSATALLA